VVNLLLLYLQETKLEFRNYLDTKQNAFNQKLFNVDVADEILINLSLSSRNNTQVIKYHDYKPNFLVKS
jgi:hypothetical protein